MCGYILFSKFLRNHIVNIEAYTTFSKYKIIIFWQISLQITFLSDKVKVNLALYVFVFCFNEASSSVTSFKIFLVNCLSWVLI